MVSCSSFDTMVLFVFYSVSVIFTVVSANEDSYSINKPITRSPKSWHFSTDYVRCFCNLPSCVTTGYMCKSSGGGCFSDVDQSSSYYRGRHGCVELLIESDPKRRCQTKGGNERTMIKWKDNPKSLLLCCYHDMCNHIENSPLRTIINSTLLGDVADDTHQQQQETFLYSNSEVWFRAATIAVPICGAVILFVLIALAVKILKTEHQNSAVHKLGPAMYVHAVPECKHIKEKRPQAYDNLLRKDYVPIHHQNMFYPNPSDDYQQQIQVPLLVQNEIVSSASTPKNETYAKLNQMNCDVDSGKSIILEIEKESPRCSGVNIVSVRDDDKLNREKTMLP